MIEDCGSTSGEPTKRVQIAECGQIPDEGEKAEEEEEEEGKGEKQKANDLEEEEEEEEEQEGGRRGKKRPRVRFAKSDGDAKGDDESK